jgi:PAS domain S-box-containing protein
MKSALRIAVYYALLSALYIVFSDAAVHVLARGSPEVVQGWQNLKGIAFVAGSAAIIFFLLWNDARRREAIAALHEDARRSFEELFRRNPVPAWVYDTSTLEILAVNDAAIAEYGHEEAEFLRLKLTGLHPVEDVEKVLQQACRGGGEGYTGHWRHCRRDGSPVEMELASHATRLAGHDARLVVATNIGMRKITEQALAEAYVARNDAAEAKTGFLSAISHEMRTPLNAIRGYLDLLATETDERTRADYLREARRAADDLLALIERLIAAAMMSRPTLAPADRREIDLAPFLARIVDRYRQPATRKGITLSVTLAGGTCAQAQVDAARLEAVLEVLLGNAVKFSPGGAIRLTVDQPDDGRALRFQVADEGIGIPAAERNRVFELFYQVDQGTSRRYGGLGLGLFVARQLCELMGAEVAVRSGDVAGTTFVVQLPGSVLPGGVFRAA